MVDLSEPVFNLDKFDDETLWKDKVMYYQYKERIQFAYKKYGKLLFEQR